MHLTPKQQKFIHCYLRGGMRNPALVAIQAGYKAPNAKVTACKLKKHPLVRRAIREEQIRLQSVLNFSTDEAVRALLLSYHKAPTVSEEVKALGEIGNMLGLYVQVS